MKFLQALLALCVMWLVIASIVFAIRNPWTTPTEQLLHINDVFMFRKVTIAEYRSQYN